MHDSFVSMYFQTEKEIKEKKKTDHSLTSRHHGHSGTPCFHNSQTHHGYDLPVTRPSRFLMIIITSLKGPI